MMKKRILLSLVALAVSCSGNLPPPQAPSQTAVEEKVVDLSYAFDETTVYWPTGQAFELKKGPEGVTAGGWFYNANSFSAAEHGGTHLDSPYHFNNEGWKVAQIPLDRLVGAGVIVDVSERCRQDRNTLISPEDLHTWEAVNGRIPDGAIVLLRTGFGELWPDAKAYLGTAERGADAVALLSFPGLDPAAALWLAEERSIRAVGIDTASIDTGNSDTYPSHIVLAVRNILIFENLANLHQLPNKGFRVVALPMKIGEGSGAPLRIIALVPESAGNG